tara:strand:- start:924 stop:1415 length:492 start_codon:yes stop_codon:yes gene_type:complete
MILEFVLVTMLAYDFPSYFSPEQQFNASVVIDQSNRFNEDPYFMVALAWVESRLRDNRVSPTGDYGIFQINWRFWGKKQWGYETPHRFAIDMASPAHSTAAATVVLREMQKYKACRGLKLPACYNGGPAWQKSKNKEKIIKYANKVNRMHGIFKRAFPGWVQK